MSPLQFNQGNFVRSIETMVANVGLEPGSLTLEVTEGMLLDDNGFGGR